MFLAIAILALCQLGLVRSEGVNCSDKTTLDTCMNQLPAILEQAELKGIPRSAKDVEHACKAFKTGMGCMDNFLNQCFTKKDRMIFENHVAGARHTFRFLCDDPAFKSEYLKYTTCYRGITNDWDACARRFTTLVREEMSRQNVTEESRIVELCCAKHGFLRCVYLASWLKCRKEEALFLKKIADTLSNIRVYTPGCKSLDTAICSNTASNFNNHILVLIIVVALTLVSQ